MRIASHHAAVGRQRMPTGATDWAISPACRELIAGRTFLIDGRERNIDHRVAGPLGLQSDVLVMRAAGVSARDLGVRSIIVGELEAAIAAGRVAMIVDARDIDAGIDPTRLPAPADDAPASTVLRPKPRNSERPPVLNPLLNQSTPASIPPSLRRVHLATAAGSVTSVRPAAIPTRSKSATDWTRWIIATINEMPATSIAHAYDQLLQSWAPKMGCPPSYGTVCRWLRHRRAQTWQLGPRGRHA